MFYCIVSSPATILQFEMLVVECHQIILTLLSPSRLQSLFSQYTYKRETHNLSNFQNEGNESPSNRMKIICYFYASFDVRMWRELTHKANTLFGAFDTRCSHDVITIPPLTLTASFNMFRLVLKKRDIWKRSVKNRRRFISCSFLFIFFTVYSVENDNNNNNNTIDFCCKIQKEAMKNRAAFFLQKEEENSKPQVSKREQPAQGAPVKDIKSKFQQQQQQQWMNEWMNKTNYTTLPAISPRLQWGCSVNRHIDVPPRFE